MDRTLQRELYAQLDKLSERHALAYINYRGEFSWRTLGEVCKQAAGIAQDWRNWAWVAATYAFLHSRATFFAQRY